MKIITFNNRLKEYDVKTDEFGRLVIEDNELMEYITGAVIALESTPESNVACGGNSRCGNLGCSNIETCMPEDDD